MRLDAHRQWQASLGLHHECAAHPAALSAWSALLAVLSASDCRGQLWQPAQEQHILIPQAQLHAIYLSVLVLILSSQWLMTSSQRPGAAQGAIVR